VPKAWEGQENLKQIKKVSTQNIDKILKTTWTPLNLESTSPWQKYSSKTSYKKEKENNTEPKGTSKNLMKGKTKGQVKRGPSYALAGLGN
jgi:hypothetical protein